MVFMDYKYLHSTLIEAAHLAGKTMLSNDRTVKRSKFNKELDNPIVSSVTKADIATEKALRKFFAKKLPDFNIFGEELGAKYNDNGKVIVMDPIDGTYAFSQGRPTFGTIISVYVDGKNIGGVEYNVMKDVMYVGTIGTGFQRIGKRLKPKRMLYLGSLLLDKDLAEKIRTSVRKEFKSTKFATFSEYDILSKCMVCEGDWEGIFVPTWSLHDLGPIFLFGELTGTKVTDHRGREIRFDPIKELNKYNDGRRDVVYSQPVIIAKPKIHKKMMKALKPFWKEFDAIMEKGKV